MSSPLSNNVSTLNVLLSGEPIATITHVGNDRTLFAFNEAYANDETRPVLSLGFKDALGGLITQFKPTQTTLDGMVGARSFTSLIGTRSPVVS